MRRAATGLVTAVLMGAALGACSAPAGRVTVRERTSAAETASGQPIRLPGGDVRIVLSEYEIPAGAVLPVHRHPHPRLAIVREGTLDVTNVETGGTVRYGAGDLIVEAVGQPHWGATIGTAPVRLWVVDALPAGVESNTLLEPRE